MSSPRVISEIVVNYPPISISDTPSSGYRVIMLHDDQKTYYMCVGDSAYRIFTADTLPPDIKVKVAILSVADKKARYTSVYDNSFGEEYEDIGWFTAHSPFKWYCLVMSKERLWELRGGALYDTRKQGKK